MKDFSKKELKWINQLQKILDKQPDSLQVFDNESGIAVFKSNELPVKSNLAVDSEYEYIKHINTKQGHWEAGAW